MENNLIYTNIQHIPRKKFGLSLNEYCLCDMIYHLSNNPKYNWCIMTKENMALELGISKRSVINFLDILIKKELLIRDEQTKYLKTSQVWFENFITDGAKIAPSVQKGNDGANISPDTVQKLHGHGAKIAPNNNIDNNKDNILDKSNIEQSSELIEYGNKEINRGLEFLKQAVGISDFKENRKTQGMRMQNIRQLSEKIGKEELLARLKYILQDDFKAKNCNSINYLYKELKAFIHSPIVPTEPKGVRIVEV